MGYSKLRVSLLADQSADRQVRMLFQRHCYDSDLTPSMDRLQVGTNLIFRRALKSPAMD
jgi:hypothetical protein